MMPKPFTVEEVVKKAKEKVDEMLGRLPLCEKCSGSMKLAWASYFEGVCTQKAWKCEKCKSVVKEGTKP